MLKKLLTLGLLASAAASSLAGGPNLKLSLWAFGTGSTSAWRPVTGSGAVSHQLLLQKNAATTVDAAAGADVINIAGTPVGSLSSLSWMNLTPSTAGGGSPRWNLFYGPVGQSYTGYAFLDPTLADTNNDGVISNSEIMANPYFVGAPPMPGDEIKYLELIVDEHESVVLDNISVGVNGAVTTFTGPGKSK